MRWYITYRLSYRDLAAMMAERGITVSHTTILRWVLRYVPEFEKRWSRYALPVNPSWRIDETAVSVRGRNCYLYRAVDKHGKSADALLRADRGVEASQAFFQKAVATQGARWPQKVNIDGNAASHKALRLLRGFRLREVYCPLFFWSAVVLFKGSAGKDKFGVPELSAVLSKADILKARDFVYSRIEALNFVLFKMPAHFTPQNQADPFASLRSGWRLTMAALVPLFIWLGFVLLLGGLYWSVAERPLVLILIGVIGILLIVQEILQRQRRYKSLKDRIST